MHLPNKRFTAKTFIFRRWSRKPYAIFRSLNIEIKIAGLALVLAAVMLPDDAIAQDQDTIQVNRNIEMDEVVVSAQRSEVIYSQTARTVEVLEKNEIERLPVQTIDGLLEYAMNVDVRQRGSMNVQSDISIRAGSFDKVMVLLNGVNVTDPQTGHHNLNLPLDLSAIKRIEILSGPGSRIFGPNAFNGAVNIIIGPDEEKNIRLALHGGQHGYGKATADLTARTGDMKHFLAADYSRSDGYTENSDYRMGSAFYRNIWEFSDHRKLDLQVGYDQKEFGANSFYSPQYPEQFEATRTRFASLTHKTGESIKTEARIYGRRHNDRFELFRNESPDWYKNHNYHMTDIAGASVNTVIPLSMGKLSLGAEYRYERILSNELGEPMDDTLNVPGESEGFFDHQDQRHNISSFAEYAVEWKKLYLATGIMANNSKGFSRRWRFFPGLDLNYKFSSKWHAFATSSYGMRRPTFTDLYYEGPTNRGNPDLKPEESLSLESGIKFFDKNISARFSVFRRWGKNIIDWVRKSEQQQWQTMNLTELNTTGFSVQSQFDMKNILKRNIIRNIQISYSFADQEKYAGNYISHYALDYLKHKVNMRLNHSVIPNMAMSWSLTWQDRAGSFILYENGTFGSEKEYEPFFIADVRLNYHYRNMKIYLETSNLLDHKYYDIGNIRQPGLWLKSGINWKIPL